MASLHFERQKPIALRYKALNLECGYRLDFLVEDKLVIELKSVEALSPIFEAQILTYMRLADKPLGLLMNFNAQVLKHGLTSRPSATSPPFSSPLNFVPSVPLW